VLPSSPQPAKLQNLKPSQSLLFLGTVQSPDAPRGAPRHASPQTGLPSAVMNQSFSACQQLWSLSPNEPGHPCPWLVGVTGPARQHAQRQNGAPNPRGPGRMGPALQMKSPRGTNNAFVSPWSEYLYGISFSKAFQFYSVKFLTLKMTIR
jgi:hypothetical protein